MPTRSTGCIKCRRRKIRCDQGLPGCERCAIHGVRCPGYSNERVRGIEFKDHTSSTVKRAEQRYNTKALPSREAIRWDDVSPLSLPDDSATTTPNSGRSISEGSTTASDTEEDFVTSQTLSLPPDAFLNSVISLRSPSAERAQIYGEFIATYLPIVRYGAQNAYFSFYQAIAQKPSEQPVLIRSMDALSLVQLGSLHKDQRLLKEAVRQYGGALRYLSTSIAQGDFLHDDDVLAAISCLASCELFEEIARCGEGWGQHVEGANQLVAARGPQSFKSELALLLYSNMRHGALLYALISRKAPFMAAPAWRKLAFQSPLVRDESTRFYDVALQVPGVLQRHDEIDLGASNALAEIDGVLEESTRLEAELKSWYTEWQGGATLENQNDCELRPIEEFTTFASSVPDRTFDYAYRFPDFLVAYFYSLHFMVMHFLRTNIQSLQKLRHRVADEWYPSPGEEVPEDELLGYVLSLCQCMPFFVEPMSNSAGHIGIFLPMRTAALYFTDHGHWQLLKWIGSVKSNVFVKGLAPPEVKATGR